MRLLRAILGLGLLIGCSIFTVQADPIKQALLAAADSKANGEYTRRRFLDSQKMPFNTADARKKLLLIGDSHAQDFLNAVLDNGYLGHYQIRTRYMPTRCQIVYRYEQALPFIQVRDRALCAKADTLEQVKDQWHEADVVILVARWQEWAAKLLADALVQLPLSPKPRLIVLGAKDFGKVNVPQYLNQPPEALKALQNKVDPAPLAANPILQQIMQGKGEFIDQQALICGAGETCRLFTEDARLITYDGGHLTPDGAKWVGKRLFNHPILKTL